MVSLDLQSYSIFVIIIECLFYRQILTANVNTSVLEPKRRIGNVESHGNSPSTNATLEEVRKSEENVQERFNFPDGEQDESAAVDKMNRMLHKPYTNWHMGKVPYYLDTESYDDIIADRIRIAMDAIEMSSCVVFERRRNKIAGGNWVHITNPEQLRECVHKYSRGQQGELIMVLGYDCMTSRDILHSLMHVLGFKDEVTHPQRDMYVRILWENIHPNYRSLFRLNTEPLPYDTKVEYDTMSVMHFHVRAYSANGKATIVPLIPGLVFTPTNSLSQLDIMKLGLAYGHECNKRKVDELIKTCKKSLNPDHESYEDDYDNDHSDTTTIIENDGNDDGDGDDDDDNDDYEDDYGARDEEKDNDDGQGNDNGDGNNGGIGEYDDENEGDAQDVKEDKGRNVHDNNGIGGVKGRNVKYDIGGVKERNVVEAKDQNVSEDKGRNVIDGEDSNMAPVKGNNRIKDNPGHASQDQRKGDIVLH